MVKDDDPRIVGDWRRSESPRRDKSGCGFAMSYGHIDGRFRILHYLSLGELPFVALDRLKPIGRLDMLDKAKAACERYAPTSGKAAVNSLGDSILPDGPSRRAAKRKAKRRGT